MRRDRIADFFKEKTPHRALLLLLFVGLLVVFRRLGMLLVFFVAFERLLFFSAGLLSRRFKWSRGMSLGITLGSTAVALALVAWGTAGRIARVIVETRETLPQRIAAIRESQLYLQLREHLPDSERLVESAREYGVQIARSAAEVGHVALLALIGLVLAIVYFLEEDKVRAFTEGLEQGSIGATLARWFSGLADAVSLTIQLQLIVALCNTVATLPVLLVIGVPHVPALMLLIFLSGLIPVVGNLISGAVLCVVAYQAKGMPGVALFLVLTFALHKVESYYLNPRLTARHVNLPAFVLILSLILWEQLLGFVGLFVSFPFLFLAGKIRGEFKAEDDPEGVVTPPTPVAPAPAPAPAVAVAAPTSPPPR